MPHIADKNPRLFFLHQNYLYLWTKILIAILIRLQVQSKSIETYEEKQIQRKFFLRFMKKQD